MAINMAIALMSAQSLASPAPPLLSLTLQLDADAAQAMMDTLRVEANRLCTEDIEVNLKIAR